MVMDIDNFEEIGTGLRFWLMKYAMRLWKSEQCIPI